jgi:uncharacterized DUF497 family protein
LNYNFEWDPQKARINLHKHGISFERAATVFIDPAALSVFDEEHSGPEERWITLGIDRSGVPLIVCHTFSEESGQAIQVRIFSARKAAKKEIKQYERK